MENVIMDYEKDFLHQVHQNKTPITEAEMEKFLVKIEKLESKYKDYDKAKKQRKSFLIVYYIFVVLYFIVIYNMKLNNPYRTHYEYDIANNAPQVNDYVSYYVYGDTELMRKSAYLDFQKVNQVQYEDSDGVLHTDLHYNNYEGKSISFFTSIKKLERLKNIYNSIQFIEEDSDTSDKLRICLQDYFCINGELLPFWEDTTVKIGVISLDDHSVRESAQHIIMDIAIPSNIVKTYILPDFSVNIKYLAVSAYFKYKYDLFCKPENKNKFLEIYKLDNLYKLVLEIDNDDSLIYEVFKVLYIYYYSCMIRSYFVVAHLIDVKIPEQMTYNILYGGYVFSKAPFMSYVKSMIESVSMMSIEEVFDEEQKQVRWVFRDTD